MALDHGWVPERGHELEWDDMIQNDDHVIVNKEWLEGMELQEPQEWNPAAELVRYIETLFEAGDNVGYVTGAGSRKTKKGHAGFHKRATGTVRQGK